MNPRSVHALLKKYGIAPRKRLGQHFLVAMPTVEKIVAALGTGPHDIVLEIGSGLGIMTALAARCTGRVIAVDRDPALLDIARAEFGDIPNIEWVHADILEVSLVDALARYARALPDARSSGTLKILGNLPYNMSSPILFWMLDQRTAISRAIVMVQKEVALRIVATPGGKEYGILSVFVQAYGRCSKLFDVSAKSFVPPPQVTSSVLDIAFAHDDRGITNDAFFRAIVKSAFGKRRKTLRNALLGAPALGITSQTLDAALAACTIDGRRRPETLSVGEFICLANQLIR